MRFTEQQKAAWKAYDDAMIEVLGDCPGNVAELCLVLDEMAQNGDEQAASQLEGWQGLMVEARKAAEAAEKAVLEGGRR